MTQTYYDAFNEWGLPSVGEYRHIVWQWSPSPPEVGWYPTLITNGDRPRYGMRWWN